MRLWALLVTTWLRSGSTCSGIALLIVFLAMSHPVLLAMMSTRATELISILGVEFKQAGCLLVVKTIFLDDSVGTVLHHLSLVGLLAVLALTLLLFLGENLLNSSVRQQSLSSSFFSFSSMFNCLTLF